MPAITRWSRSSECSRRDSRAQIASSASTPSPSASGPRCASSASAASGVSSQTPARFFEPASVSTSLAPPSKRSWKAGTFGPFSLGSRYLSRPAVIRWTSSTSSPSSVVKSSRFARRSAPASFRPSSADSGGSNVFSVATFAGPAFTIGKADTGSFSARRHASISGSSGIGDHGSERRCLLGQADQATDRREEKRYESDGPADRADPDRGAEPYLGGQDAACKSSERYHAPDDETPRRVHPAEQPVRCDRLHQAKAGHVVDHSAGSADREGDDDERDGERVWCERDQ